MTRQKHVLAALAAVAASLVSVSAAAGPAAYAATTEAKVVEVEHALGSTRIEGTPERIVVLEWTYAEDLLALGIQPAGVTDIAGFNAWVNVEPELAPNVVDVGTRQEPSLEAIAALRPDLVIGVEFRHAAIYDKLRQIAPTLIFNPYPTDKAMDQYAEMEATFRAIAKAVGKEASAERVLRDLNAGYAAAAEALAEAGMAENDVVLVQAFSTNNTPTLRVFVDNAMAIQIMERIGLSNAYGASAWELYGYATTGVEALAAVQGADFLYIVQETDDVFANELAHHPVWRNLAFVREGRTYALGGDTWVFGGPLSAGVLTDRIVDVLTR